MLTIDIFDWVITTPDNKWMNEVRNDMEQNNITQETIQKRTLIRNHINKQKIQEVPHKKQTQWTEERRQEHSQSIKKN